MSDLLKKEADRLFKFGFAVHAIKERSKAPVKSGWSGPVRDSIESVLSDLRPGRGLGVRLGEPSKLSNGYLAVIDVDLKSPLPRHHEEAFAIVDERFPGLREKAPCVQTGRGFHFYIRTPKPIPSGKLGSSSEEVKVHSPTSEINRRQKSLLTEDELKRGFRSKNAWEVELMSAGKQVLLPPTIHPDTRKPYQWKKSFRLIEDLPLIAVDELGNLPKRRGRPSGMTIVQNFSPVPITEDLLNRLSPKNLAMIQEGEGVTDRSAACFSVTIAMIRAGFTDLEIMTILTDEANELGQAALERRKNRASAAAWVRDYCIRKAREEVSAEKVFSKELIELPPLSEEEAKAQSDRLLDFNWESKLIRSGKEGDGPPKALGKNVLLILENAVSPKLFMRNTFANRDHYGVGAPWGARAGDLVTDDEIIRMKFWIAHQYRFEPNVNLISETVAEMAMKNAYHPIREIYADLPVWDGVPRIDTWLTDHFGAKGEPEYLAQVFRKWMVAAVKRIYEPGAKFDWMIIFQGRQGTGKSSFGALLFGEKYFTDWLPNLADKDAAIALQGIQCVEFGELDSLRKNEVETTKAFVTRQVDKFRPPHGRKTIESYRQCVFFGTTNRETYFRDETGNRRFMPIEIGRLDFERLKRDREQLWAEALFLYQNDLESNLYLESEAEEYAKKLQSDKMVEDDSNLMEESLRAFLRLERKKPKSERFEFSGFKLSTLFTDGINPPFVSWKYDSRNAQYASRALKKIGGLKKKIKGEIWWRIPDTIDE